ncbi:MAG: hypothetical protein R3C32_10610 [Chloroflexota bacterium]
MTTWRAPPGRCGRRGSPRTAWSAPSRAACPWARGSSSAALLASAWALSGADAPALDPLGLARVAQRAENDYVGMRCGLMDQFASAAGVAGSAVLLDCRSLEHRPVPLPDGVVLVVAHGRAAEPHHVRTYNERRAQCETAVAVLARHDPGFRALRDVTPAMLDRYAEELPAGGPPRAACRRGGRAGARDGGCPAHRRPRRGVGRLFAASHASLRDATVSVRSWMPWSGSPWPRRGSWRHAGAGFGGCTVSLVEDDAVVGSVSASRGSTRR